MHNCNLPAPYAALRLTGLSLLACFCVHPNTAAGADPSVRLVKEQSIKHASPGILGSLSDNQRWMIISSRADRRPDLWGMQDELWDGRRKRALKVQPSTGGLLKSQMDYRFLPKRSTALVSVRGDVEDYVRIWDIPNGKWLGEPIPHDMGVPDLGLLTWPEVSPSGDFMVVDNHGSRDGELVQFWDLRRGEPIPITKPFKHGGKVNGVKIVNGEQWCLSWTPTEVRVWELQTGKLAAGPFPWSSYGPWTSPLFSKQRQQLITFEGSDGQAKIVVRSIKEKGWPVVHQVRLGGKNHRAGWCGKDRVWVLGDGGISVVLLDADTKNAVQNIPQSGIVFPSRNDDRMVVVAGYDSGSSSISCWKFGGSKPIWERPLTEDYYRYHVETDGRTWILLKGLKGPAVMYSLEDGSELWRRNVMVVYENDRLLISDVNDKYTTEIWRVDDREK